MASGDCYQQVVDIIQKANVSAASKKCGGHKPVRRDFYGRVLPKASIRKLVHKANIARMAYGPTEHGYAQDPDKDTYSYIDQKVFSIMENVIYDAVAIAAAAKKGQTKKGGKRIIKERHMLKALSRYGGLGLSSEEARRYTH
jgi:hypothetical protein